MLLNREKKIKNGTTQSGREKDGESERERERERKKK